MVYSFEHLKDVCEDLIPKNIGKVLKITGIFLAISLTAIALVGSIFYLADQHDFIQILQKMQIHLEPSGTVQLVAEITTGVIGSILTGGGAFATGKLMKDVFGKVHRNNEDQHLDPV